MLPGLSSGPDLQQDCTGVPCWCTGTCDVLPPCGRSLALENATHSGRRWLQLFSGSVCMLLSHPRVGLRAQSLLHKALGCLDQGQLASLLPWALVSAVWLGKADSVGPSIWSLSTTHYPPTSLFGPHNTELWFPLKSFSPLWSIWDQVHLMNFGVKIGIFTRFCSLALRK